MNPPLSAFATPAITAVATAAALLIVRSVAIRILHRRATRTETKLDDIIIKSFKTPSVFWSIAIGLSVGLAVSEFPQKYVLYASKMIHVIVIFSITIAAANLSGRIFKNYVQVKRFQQEGIEIPFPHRTVYLREQKDRKQ